jgi:hypothetical protein
LRQDAPASSVTYTELDPIRGTTGRWI